MEAQRRWRWTAQRLRCLDLFVAGVSRREIARRIATHRNTINAWTTRPEFLKEARDRIDLSLMTTGREHLRESNRETSRAAELLDQALRSLEAGQTNNSDSEMQGVLQLLAEYRKQRDNERRETRDDVRYIEVATETE